MKKNQLQKSRQKIDKLDKKINLLFEKRLDEVEKIKQYKEENNLPILDQTREDEKLTKVQAKSNHQKYVIELQKSMMTISKEYQNNKGDH